jgi:hypothetical protein
MRRRRSHARVAAIAVCGESRSPHLGQASPKNETTAPWRTLTAATLTLLEGFSEKRASGRFAAAIWQLLGP